MTAMRDIPLLLCDKVSTLRDRTRLTALIGIIVFEGTKMMPVKCRKSFTSNQLEGVKKN
jgi:hypothetical protein